MDRLEGIKDTASQLARKIPILDQWLGLSRERNFAIEQELPPETPLAETRKFLKQDLPLQQKQEALKQLRENFPELVESARFLFKQVEMLKAHEADVPENGDARKAAVAFIYEYKKLHHILTSDPKYAGLQKLSNRFFWRYSTYARIHNELNKRSYPDTLEGILNFNA